jgi:hypothetical protein
MRTQIHTTSGEIDATIIKGYLENNGISSFIYPAEDLGPSYRAMRGPHVTYGIFVEEEKIKEALEALSRMIDEPKESN